MDQDPKLRFTMPFDDMSWMNTEVPLGNPHFFESLPLPIDASPTCLSQHNDFIRPPSHKSTSSLASSYCYIDQARVTEDEIWNLPPPARRGSNNTKREILSPLSPTHSHRQVSRRPYSTTDRSKPSGRLRTSTSSEEQSPTKRRQSFSDMHEDVAPAMDLEVELEDVKKKPKAKPSAKVSHSVVERRYRENLKAKIMQLDQALNSTRHAGEELSEVPSKARKADVINEAIRYVKRSKIEGGAQTKEIAFLRLRVAALEKLIHCGDCVLLKQFASQRINDAGVF